MFVCSDMTAYYCDWHSKHVPIGISIDDSVGDLIFIINNSIVHILNFEFENVNINTDVY